MLMTRCLPILLVALTTASAAEWQPVSGRIMTRWAKDVTPESAWSEYPRPQMVRDRWLNLNGLWDYAIVGESRQWNGSAIENAKYDLLATARPTGPSRWDGRILAPFAIESALSGVGKLLRPDQLLWYRRSFEIPAAWRGQRVLLHFGAVDWHAVAFVNGVRVGEHKGGYTPFQFDITDQLKPTGVQQIALAVWDPTNAGDQALGKQSLPEMRKGYRYTPTTGIWQTVWLEPVPAAHISRLKIVPDVDGSRLLVETSVSGAAAGLSVSVTAMDGSRPAGSGKGAPGERVAVRLRSPRLWSPESPHLYGLKVALLNQGKAVDSVTSYAGLRKIEIRRDQAGIARYFLNNKRLPFQLGPLDQGYWPDGVLTPPSDKAAEYDVRYLKEIGCNMARVHVKVHPDRWYYHCDRLGLLVWQDMVCTRRFDSAVTPGSASEWEAEQRSMIDYLHDHPSIIHWIVFNESWGQYDTERLTRWTKTYDPSRLATCASGWNDVADLGDVRDIHDYSFYPSIPLASAEGRRAIVLGEFGGFDVPLPGHLWHPDQKMEPKSDRRKELPREAYADSKTWHDNYRLWIQGWRYLIGAYGLNAGVYTQISDVEHELNGWMTYDRAVSKIPEAELRRLHQPLYGAAVSARRTLLAPAGGRPASEPLTRTVELREIPKNLALVCYNTPGTVDVLINGRQVMSVDNRGTRLGVGVSVVPLPPHAMGELRPGANSITLRAESPKEIPTLDFALIELDPLPLTAQ